MAFSQINQAMIVLTSAGHLGLVQDEIAIKNAKKNTEKLNRHLCQKSRSTSELNYLASPVTGGGIGVNRFQQLFLLCHTQGKKQPVEWAKEVWQLLSAQGQKLVKEGKALETPEENLVELTAQAQTFSDKLLPILKALQIA